MVDALYCLCHLSSLCTATLPLAVHASPQPLSKLNKAKASCRAA